MSQWPCKRVMIYAKWNGWPTYLSEADTDLMVCPFWTQGYFLWPLKVQLLNAYLAPYFSWWLLTSYAFVSAWAFQVHKSTFAKWQIHFLQCALSSKQNLWEKEQATWLCPTVRSCFLCVPWLHSKLVTFCCTFSISGSCQSLTWNSTRRRLTYFLDVVYCLEHTPEIELVHQEFAAVTSGTSERGIIGSANHELVVSVCINLQMLPQIASEFPARWMTRHTWTLKGKEHEWCDETGFTRWAPLTVGEMSWSTISPFTYMDSPSWKLTGFFFHSVTVGEPKVFLWQLNDIMPHKQHPCGHIETFRMD